MKNYRIDIESHKSRCNKTESVRTLIKPTVQTAVIYALYKKYSYDTPYIMFTFCLTNARNLVKLGERHKFKSLFEHF